MTLLTYSVRHHPITDNRLDPTSGQPEVKAACLCGWRDTLWCAAREVTDRHYRAHEMTVAVAA